MTKNSMSLQEMQKSWHRILREKQVKCKNHGIEFKRKTSIKNFKIKF